MVEIAHGDISLVEHLNFTELRRYEMYITRYGESGRYYFKDMETLGEYLKSAYGLEEKTIDELYESRVVVK